MKHYLIEPKTKKPIIERKFLQRTRDDGVVEMLEMETGWRWGNFMIDVPETDEEIRDLLDERGTDSLAEFLEDHNADTLEQVLLPDPDEDVTLLGWADVLDTYDSCWVVFNVSGKGLNEEQCEALSEEASEAYGDDGYEGLKNLGWQHGDVYYELHGEFELADFDACIENVYKTPSCMSDELYRLFMAAERFSPIPDALIEQMEIEGGNH